MNGLVEAGRWLGITVVAMSLGASLEAWLGPTVVDGLLVVLAIVGLVLLVVGLRRMNGRRR